MRKRFLTFCLLIVAYSNMLSQDIYLTPFQNVKSKGEINSLTFSNNTKFLVFSNNDGLLSVFNLEDRTIVKQITYSDGVVFVSFLPNDTRMVVVTESGRVVTLNANDFTEINNTKLTAKPKLINVDPTGQLLIAYSAGQIEIFDLRASMLQAKIQVDNQIKKPLFLGFDRLGQQVLLLSEFGKALYWNPYDQRLLREVVMQSGEYANSKSVIQSASTNNLGDRFVVGLQEVFIPKGGMQGRNQPERKNMVLSYDWVTGSEVKRVPVRYRADFMSFGPGSGHVAYCSRDALQIWLLNLEKGEINSSVSVTEIPSSLKIADNGEYLAVGSEKGTVSIFYVERNVPAEIKISSPQLDRSLATQVVNEAKVRISGVVEGADRISRLMVNEKPAVLDLNKSFSGEVDLAPGKNKVRIVAQNTEGKFTTRDFYVTYEPKAESQQTLSQHVGGGKRVALVIGNSGYQSIGKLNNTINDATAIAQTLTDLNFEVIKIIDGEYEDMKNAVYAFGDRIQDVDVSLFYYAGHGLEVDGSNYLVPVDADIQSALDVKQKAIPLNAILKTMELTNEQGLNMIILDACRNNPFPTGKRGGSGLGKVNAPSGTLIAYATDPGSVASDGTGKNGLYTGELVKQLKISQRIEDVFMNTRNHVEEISKGAQRPWEEARLKGIFYLR
jgi:WD40 repeat protein